MRIETATTEIQARRSARDGYIRNALQRDTLKWTDTGDLTVSELSDAADNHADDMWFDYLSFDTQQEVGRWADAVSTFEFQCDEFEFAAKVLAARQNDALAMSIHRVEVARCSDILDRDENLRIAVDEMCDVLAEANTEGVSR